MIWYIKVFLKWWFLIARRHDKESEQIMNLVFVDSSIIDNANRMAVASAVKIEASDGRRSVAASFPSTAAAATRSPSFEPSV